MEKLEIYKKLPLLMGDIGAVGKSGFNKLQSYKFRSIDDIYNALQPQLAKHGVFIVPNIMESKEEHFESKNGTQQIRVKMKVKYTIFASDGSFVETYVEGEGIDSSDKATNKAFTAAFKYMAIQVFCLAIEDSNDPDAMSPEIGKQKQAYQPQQKPPLPNFAPQSKTGVAVSVDGKITEVQASSLWSMAKAKKITDEQVLAVLQTVGGVSKTTDLKSDKYDEVIRTLNGTMK